MCRLSYLFSVDVSCDADDGLDEDGEGEEAAVCEDHGVALSRDPAAAEESDGDDETAGEEDDDPGDLEDAGGEEGEELASVYKTPEAETEARQAEHEEEDVVAVEGELEAGERTGG